MAGQVRSIVPGQGQGLQKQRHEDLERDGGGLPRRRRSGRSLSGADEQNIWLATDNGMILKLK